MDAFSEVDIASTTILNHAQTVYDERTSDIRTSIREEEDDLMTKLRKKHAKEESELRNKMIEKKSILMNDANTKYTVIKTKIDAACGEKTSDKAASENIISPCNCDRM